MSDTHHGWAGALRIVEAELGARRSCGQDKWLDRIRWHNVAIETLDHTLGTVGKQLGGQLVRRLHRAAGYDELQKKWNMKGSLNF